MKHWRHIFYGVLGGLIFIPCLRPALRVETLTCDYQVAPLLVEGASPRFGWQLEGRQGTMQSAYAIEVETADGEVVWQSGKVASTASQLVPYAGEALLPMHTYRWRVQAWNERDKASRWSDYATFTTAPSAEWLQEGAWIGAITYADARMPEGRKFHGGELKKPEVRAAWEAVDS